MSAQFFSAYHIDGDPDTLATAYDRLMESFDVDDILLHVCVRTERGISVFDTCPSREAFEEISASERFRSAFAAAGLPFPRVEALGEIHRSYATTSVVAG